MTTYICTEEEQRTRNQILAEVFDIEDNVPVEEFFVETVPWVTSELQSRPGEMNGMYGWKWGDKHPKGMLGKKHSEETKQKWSQSRKGKTPWNLGVKSPEHSEFMKTKMVGNSNAKGIKYPKCSCTVCKKTISSNTLSRHLLSHD